jgi:UDPglucose 6-dehydrogenase
MNIGIIGNGFVGRATRQLESSRIHLYVYDINPELCVPCGLSLEELNVCDIIFVSVPTPMEENGKCHLNIVESVVEKLSTIIDPKKNFVVIRSTVPPGTCDRLNCYFMPEFLTEKNYMNDFINCPEWVFGLPLNENNELFKNKITQLFQYAFEEKKINYNVVYFKTNKEAEMIKYFRNCFLATKISFCNEMEEFCRRNEINYENVRSFATSDIRIGSSHTSVPGHDEKRGFGGTCFPKDTSALLYDMNSIGMKSYVLESVVERNQKVDRNEKDWNENKGRCVV